VGHDFGVVVWYDLGSEGLLGREMAIDISYLQEKVGVLKWEREMKLY